MKHLLCSSLALVIVALTGCANWAGPGPSAPAPGPEADEQLMFLDRLAAAEPDELERTGRELRRALEADGDRGASLRYALWLATPRHPGHDAEAARRRLEDLLVEPGALSAETRALIRIELRILRTRTELRAANDRLTRENEQLREKIRALTELERQMGSDEQ